MPIIVKNVQENITVQQVSTPVTVEQISTPVTVTQTLPANVTVTSQLNTINVKATVFGNIDPMLWHNQVVTLTATDITNAFVHLDFLPKLNSLSLLIQSAPSQVETVSYTVTGTTLLWSGYSLQSVLIVGDILNIKYQI